MEDVIHKCSVCAALLDPEDLFCANCGAEAETSGDHQQTEAGQTTHSFTCTGCGASMSYDASAQTLVCPFCGSKKLEADQQRCELLARYVVEFAVGRETVQRILRDWLAKDSFFRPRDLSSQAMVTKVIPVYVPYWIFSARTFTYWTADSSAVPRGASGNWCPVGGEHRDVYNGILIGASSTLSPAETGALCPYDMSLAKPRTEVDQENYVVEQFRVQRKYARPLAREAIEHFEREKCARYVDGRVRNLKVNSRLEGLSSYPILLPVWILAYQYKGQLYRFLVNGQNGKQYGSAPVSYARLITVLLIVLLVIMFLFALLAGAGAIGSVLKH